MLLDKSSLHIHIVRPASSKEISEDEPMMAYVLHAFCELDVTAGHEKVVEGPRVCDITGCKVDN